MQWLGRILGPTRHEIRSRLATQLAEELAAPLWKRVQKNSVGMGPHELRGYIRARAGAIVERNISTLMNWLATEQISLTSAERETVLAQALDRAIHLLIPRLLAQRAIPMRRAA